MKTFSSFVCTPDSCLDKMHSPLPKLFDVICDAYTPRPNVIHLKEICDFKICIADHEKGNVKVLAQLNNISFNHVFLITKNNTSGCILLHAK